MKIFIYLVSDVVREAKRIVLQTLNDIIFIPEEREGLCKDIDHISDSAWSFTTAATAVARQRHDVV